MVSCLSGFVVISERLPIVSFSFQCLLIIFDVMCRCAETLTVWAPNVTDMKYTV